tara:strand:+ start:739 stop:1083 length:345 start_codon:yes stop_codon:yes gene_type:complete
VTVILCRLAAFITNQCTELSTVSGDKQKCNNFDENKGGVMPFILAGAFILGLVIAYLLFARSANNRANQYEDDLKAAKSLLDDAQKEREQLKQELADTQYKLKETEKDLKHAQK